MKRYITFRLDDESEEEILVEVEVPEKQYGMAPVGLTDDDPAKAAKSFDRALDTIQPVARKVMEKMQHLQPDSVEVTFGLKMNSKAGALIASASAEANFSVKLAWKRPAPTAP
ncbi:MAG: CU044_2847 family protein [Bacteroidota bacterium]